MNGDEIRFPWLHDQQRDNSCDAGVPRAATLTKKHPAEMPCIHGSFELLLGTGRAESIAFDFQSRHVGHNGC